MSLQLYYEHSSLQLYYEHSSLQVQDIGLLDGTLVHTAEAELFQWLTSLMSNGNCLADGVKDWLLTKLTTRTSNHAGLGMELYRSFCACFMCVNDIIAPATGWPDLGQCFKVSAARGIEGLWALFLHSDDEQVVLNAKSFLLLLYGKAFLVPSQEPEQAAENDKDSELEKALKEIDDMDETDEVKNVMKESVYEQYPDTKKPSDADSTVATPACEPFDERYLLIEEVPRVTLAMCSDIICCML